MITSIYRTVILYIIVVAMLRFMGKRQIGELQPSELVATVFITNLASISVENPGDPLLNTVMPILTLGFFEVIMSALTLKSNRLRKLLAGSPVVVVREGELDIDALKSIRFSIDELYEQMRSSGYFSLDDIFFAIVETNGNLSFYPKVSSRTVTCADLGMDDNESIPPVIVINDSYLDKNSLKYLEIDKAKIDDILEKEKLTIKQVFLMYMYKNGDYKLIPKKKR